MTDKPKKFWIVWNPEGRNPSRRHDKGALAVTEAGRLARANPGQQFFVMEVMGFARVEKPSGFTYMDHRFEQDVELPF